MTRGWCNSISPLRWLIMHAAIRSTKTHFMGSLCSVKEKTVVLWSWRAIGSGTLPHLGKALYIKPCWFQIRIQAKRVFIKIQLSRGETLQWITLRAAILLISTDYLTKISPRYHKDPLVLSSIGLPTLSLASPQLMRQRRGKAIESGRITRESTVLMIKQQKIASGTILTSVWILIIIDQRSSEKVTMKKSKKSLSLRSIRWSSKTTRRTLKGAPRPLCSCETQQQLLQANSKSKECPLFYRKTR